jgi:HSP20 family molecular chaperone IbpA
MEMLDLVPRGFFDFPSRSLLGGDDWMTRASGVTVTEDDDHVVVQAAVPGVDPDALEVTYHKGMLHVRTKDSAVIERVSPDSFRRSSLVRTCSMPLW